MKALGVLFVEDSEADARLVATLVEPARHITLHRVGCLQAALERLRNESFDAILLDLSLPDSGGLETLRRTVAAAPDIPVIVLTGLDNDHVASQAVACGAQDYLVKDESLARGALLRCLRYAVERKRSERSREETLCFQQAVLDALACHLAVIDEQGRIVAVNAAWRRFAQENGLTTPDAGVGLSYLENCECLDDSDAQQVAAGIRQILAGEIELFEHEYPCHSETERRWFVLRATRFAWQGPTHVALAHEDVTQRRLAEDALRDSRKRFQRAIDGSSDGFWDWDVAAGDVWCSPQTMHLLGLSPADRGFWINEFWEFLHPDDHEYLRQSLEKHFNEQAPYDIEFRLRHAAGEYRWFRSRGFACRDADGKPLRMSGSIQDVTERRLTNEKLQHLAAIVESSNDAIFSTSIDGVIQFWSRGAERLYGYSAEEMVGQKKTKLIPAAAQNEMAELLAKLLDHGCVDGFEATRLRKDGREIEVSISIAPVCDERGRIVCLASIHRDVTEQNASRRALKEKDLQLSHKQKLEAVGSLAGGIAHEFNNLLHVISGYARLALDESDGCEQRCEDLGRVINAAERAATLTKRILQFSRREELHRSCVDANRLVSELATLLRPLIGEQIELSVSLDEPSCLLAADYGLLEQMLLNLCVNARDAMPEGGVLTIRTRRLHFDEPLTSLYAQAPPGDYLLLAVGDTGHGMTAEVLERLFEPFHTTKPVGSGTGLGLPFVYGVVRQHGGVIDVKTAPGLGCVFYVYLPIDKDIAATEQAGASGLRDAREPVADASLRPARKRTILVAEDDQPVRDFAVRILSAADYRVLTAVDGVEAIRVIAEQRDNLDLALLDMVMPKRNGRDVYEAVQAMAPRTKIVLSSGYLPEAGFDEFIAREKLALLQKPFTAVALLGTIQDALRANETCAVT
ncbi:MAG TPA: PAS domain S-box protein [Pirellulales bacterium]|nr:PAS domain S-box protein [Pirellulales bacterium]